MPRRYRPTVPLRHYAPPDGYAKVAVGGADADEEAISPIVMRTLTVACWILAIILLMFLMIYIIATTDAPFRPPPCAYRAEIDEVICPSVAPRRMLEKRMI